MKRLIAVAVLALGLGLAAVIGQADTNETVIVSWDYPASEISNMTFRVYQSTNITTPLTNWNVLATVKGTNEAPPIQVVGGLNYFAVSSSNFWGAVFSSVVSIPALPRSDVSLQVRRK